MGNKSAGLKCSVSSALCRPVQRSETWGRVDMQQGPTLTEVVLDMTRPGKLINAWPGDTTANIQAEVVSGHRRVRMEGEAKETAAARLEKLDKLIDVSLKIELIQQVCTITKSSIGFQQLKVLLDDPWASWTLAYSNDLTLRLRHSSTFLLCTNLRSQCSA